VETVIRNWNLGERTHAGKDFWAIVQQNSQVSRTTAKMAAWIIESIDYLGAFKRAGTSHQSAVSCMEKFVNVRL